MPVDYDDLNDVDKLFHLSIAKSMNNKIILDETKSLLDKSLRIRSLSNIESNERYINSIKEHLEICDFILKGEKKEASSSMLKHLNMTLEGYKF